MEEMVFRPTKALIDLKAIQHNIQQVRNWIQPQTSIIAVVKADGYGHGAIEVAKTAIAAGAEMLAVSTPEEALQLRSAGQDAELLILGATPVQFAPIAAAHQITLTVFDADWLKRAMAYLTTDESLKVHIKIDSGMGRIGLYQPEQLADLLRIVNADQRIQLDGVFTHFARADERDETPTQQQFQTFMSFVNRFPQKPRLVHACNSAATFLYPHYHLDAVRFGISMYGLPPSDYVAANLPIQLQRAFSLETELVAIKQMPKGTPISYGGTYITKDDEWIGTLPIGYADGLKRQLKGQEVLVRGERVPIVGTICMDQCMIKLPRYYPIGEQVVLIGQQGNEQITLEEWADRLKTIPYEVAVSLGNRVTRIV